MRLTRLISACFVTFIAGVLSPAGIVRSASAGDGQVDTLRAAAKEAPGDAGRALALGRALRRSGRAAEALTELRRGSLLASGRSGETAIALRYELARVFLDGGKFNEAMGACRAVTALAQGAGLGHACTAQAHLLRNRATEALPEVELALKASPGLYEAKVAEGDGLGLQGAPGPAEQSYREAVAKDAQRPEAHLHLGELLLRAGKQEEAIAELRTARSADGDDADTAYALGDALGGTEEGATTLSSAVAARPSFGAAWSRLAEVQLARGLREDAEKAALASLKIDSTKAKWHATLAKVYEAEGRHDDAIKEARAALSILANEADAKLVEADALAHKGEIDLATEAYQLAFGFARTDPAALVHATLACLAAGRDTSAKGFADRAVQLFPHSSATWAALGDVLVKARDSAGARKAFEAALREAGAADRPELSRKLGLLK